MIKDLVFSRSVPNEEKINPKKFARMNKTVIRMLSVSSDNDFYYFNLYYLNNNVLCIISHLERAHKTKTTPKQVNFYPW